MSYCPWIYKKSGEVKRSGLSSTSLFHPPGNVPPSISVFKDLVLKVVGKLKIKKHRNNRRFNDGLESLQSRNDIIVCPTDPANSPGSPIISSLDSVTSHIGKYIDGFLQPLVSKTPSFLKDSSQENYIMATADVASLYTIISHHNVFEAVEMFLKRDSN